jgi:heat shock protein HtpX
MKRAGVGRDLGLTLHMLVTVILLAALYVLLGLVVWSLTALYDPVLVIAIAVFALIGYFATSGLVLRLTGARVVEPEEAPDLHDAVERLSALADVRKPRIAIVDSTIPNAFAVARSERSAVIAVTSSLRKRLDERELEAVLAHELSHIANRDVLVMTPASFFPIAASFLWEWLTILWPIAALLFVTGGSLSLTLARYREYAADRGAALLTGRPEDLMSALQKIAKDVSLIPRRDLRATAGMSALFIVSTSSARWRIWTDHPPLDERLAHLSEISRELGRARP